MNIDQQPRVAASSTANSAVWLRYGVAWALVAVGILLFFRHDIGHMVGLWWNSATFGHCLLIPPILAWLMWQRREGLVQLVPRPWLPAIGLMLAGGLGWLLGELAGVALVRHAAVVVLLQASVLAVFGLTVARALAFPLFFALFMIPAGEQLVPYLQDLTARFCVAMLELFDVPAFLDGVFISIPNGDFEVAEACSGVRFLIAMVAFGVLVANVCFKSWTRRIAFVLASIILPVIANGIRAWGTIYIAHLTTPEFARGVDHVVYGWIFFAIVMTLLLVVGWRFFDRPVDDPIVEPAKLQPRGALPGPPALLAGAVAGALLLSGVAPAYAALVADREPDARTIALRLPTPDGWSRTSTAGFPWRPHYKGATATALASFVDSGGQPVELYIALFDKQDEQHELIGYQQGVLPPDSDWAWATDQAPPPGGHAFQINAGPVVREVWQYYWVNGKLVSSPYAAKIEGLKAKLLGGPLQAAAVVIAAQRVDPMVSARPAIDRFARALGPIDRLIKRAVVTEEGA